MKSLVILFALLGFGLFARAQHGVSPFTITTDTLILTSCDSSELMLRNHTDTVPGFLFNTGHGLTAFKRSLQSIGNGSYIIGADTLRVPTNAWLQGGNSWGTNGILGTWDKNNLDLYTNHTQQVRIDTLGSLLVGYTANSGYKLDVNGPSRFRGWSDVTAGDAYDILEKPDNINGFTGSSILFGNVVALISVNKAAYGNIPQGSMVIGGTSPYKITTLVDYYLNPIYVVDGVGAATINGGYYGINTGGTVGYLGNYSAPTFSINGGRGTGTGTPGDIVFSTGTAQGSGTTIHAMTNRWWLKGQTGYLSNSSTPTSSVDITGGAGYSQFRLRTSYTPTSSSDTNGNVGDFSWDDNYLYIKTSSGWKRSALTTF